jgi:HSP20 family protein
MKTLALANRNGAPVFFNDLFDGFSPIFHRFFEDDLKSVKAISRPSVNVKETEQAFVLELAAPGLNKSDFNIKLEKDVLSVSAEVKHENEAPSDNYKRKEFSYAQFKRSFTLPENVNKDHIHAEYKDGILYITLTKSNNEKENLKQITVK